MGGSGCKRGISLLLEVVLGLGIFTSALLLMLSVFPSVHRGLTQAKNYRTATAIATSALEREMTREYLPMPGPQNYLDRVVTTLDGKTVTTDFTVDIVRQTFDPGLPGEYQTIQVRVSWTEATIDREVLYETFKIQ